MPGNSRPRDFCAFCGLTPSGHQRLVAGPGVTICESCVAAAAKILGGTSTGRAPQWDCGINGVSGSTRQAVCLAGMSWICR